jgi:hypothetical protein
MISTMRLQVQTRPSPACWSSTTMLLNWLMPLVPKPVFVATMQHEGLEYKCLRHCLLPHHVWRCQQAQLARCKPQRKKAAYTCFATCVPWFYLLMQHENIMEPPRPPRQHGAAVSIISAMLCHAILDCYAPQLHLCC